MANQTRVQVQITGDTLLEQEVSIVIQIEACCCNLNLSERREETSRIGT